MRVLDFRVGRQLIGILIELQFKSLDDRLRIPDILRCIKASQNCIFLLFEHFQVACFVNVGHNLVVLLAFGVYKLQLARRLQIAGPVAAKLRHEWGLSYLVYILTRKPPASNSSIWKHRQLEFELTQQSNFYCLVLLKEVSVSVLYGRS